MGAVPISHGAVVGHHMDNCEFYSPTYGPGYTITRVLTHMRINTYLWEVLSTCGAPGHILHVGMWRNCFKTLPLPTADDAKPIHLPIPRNVKIIPLPMISEKGDLHLRMTVNQNNTLAYKEKNQKFH